MISLLSSRLHPLRHAGNEAHLAFFPSELTVSEVILVILVFIGRQALHLVGLGNQFQIKTGSGGDGGSYELPELAVSMPFRFTEAYLGLYAAALNTGSEASVAYNDPKVLLDSAAKMCVLLSAFSEPAMLLVLGHHRSPVRPLGAVNVRNKFDVLRPDLCTADVLMKGRCGVVARLVRQARRVKRGLEIDVVVEIVSYEEEPVVVVYRQVFTMLQFMRSNKRIGVSAKQKDELSIDELARQAKSRPFTMTMSSPTAWARVCKDYNPIHMSKVAAKIFGFRSTIAHGNHALAVALEQFESNHDFSCDTKDKPFSMEVQFRKPIVLPATLGALIVQEGDYNYSFFLKQKNKICVSASLSQAEDR